MPEDRGAFQRPWGRGGRSFPMDTCHFGRHRTDWGIVSLGTPLRDVSYFLSMVLSIEDRRRHERELPRPYLDLRASGAGAPIAFHAAWRSHRIHAAYTVIACCQMVTFPENVSEGRRIFSEAFLARAEAAIADVGARAALREAAGL